MLPNFLIIGAMKSGTTTLYHLLKSHPDVFMAETKEPQFFSDQEKMASSMSRYESLFKDVGNEKAIGEASTNYAKYPLFKDVPEHIKEHIPDARLIYIIRNPVERAYSQFMHNYYIGRVGKELHSALTGNPNYVFISSYHMQLQRYLNVFDRDQVKVVLLEDLRDVPGEVIKDVYEFLNVDTRFIPANMKEHKHQTRNKAGKSRPVMEMLRNWSFYNEISNNIPENMKGILNSLLRKKVDPPPRMTMRDREYLVEQLRDDVLSLQAYLNRDLSAWLK